MGLREIYHSLEDQWYALLDKVEPIVPVYKVIDPIDEKVPSFAVFSSLVGLFLLVFVILPLIGIGGSTSVVLTFVDEDTNPVQGVEVHAFSTSYNKTLVTNSVGKVVFDGVPNGPLQIEVEDPDYQSFFVEETISSSNNQFTLTLRSSNITPELTFQLVDEGGQSLAGKTMQVTLSCTSGVPVVPSVLSVSNGVFTVKAPKGCESLIANVNGNGYAKLEGYLLGAGNTIITLQSIELEKGTLRVTVNDAATGTALDGLNVDVYTEQGVFTQSLLTNAFGVASFKDVSVGSYYVSVSDPFGNYALGTSETVFVSANQIVPLTVSMSKAIQGTISVRIEDKLSKAYLANATVKVVRKSDGVVKATQITPTQEGTLTFALDEQGPFLVTASHSDYLSESKDIGTIQGNQTIVIGMEKLTAANSGKVTIHVKDEDGIPVDNAQVLLYDAASKFIAQQYPPSITDSNGNANFTGVQTGTYFARATKFPAGPSDSPIFTTNKSTPAKSEISLTIGIGTVEVLVTDAEKNPIPFATVEFLTDGTDECVPGKCQVQTNALGKVTQTFKADRKVYAKVSAQGFSNYASMSYQLYPNTTKTIPVILPKTILGQTPFIRLKEVRNPLTQTKATEMKAGKTYTLVFELSIPTPLNDLDKAGMHIRVGDEAFLENDVLRILSLNTPGAQIVKGTTYQPQLGFESDEENLTFGEAKWANAEWGVADPGVYEVGVNVRVAQEAGPLTALPIYYRGWGVKGSEWLRDPVDAVLGTSASVPGKEGQYAETFQQIYFQGKPIVCDELFCFSGEQLFNADDELLVDGPPFNGQVNKEYEYSFVLTSTSPTLYANPRLRAFIAQDGFIPSDEAQFTGYTVTGTNGQILQSSGLVTNDVPGGEGQGLTVGPLAQYQTISGKYTVLTKQDEGTQIVIQLINEGEIVFEHIAGMSIGKAGNLIVNVDPTSAGAFIPTTFAIHVEDGQGFDVQDALVTLLKIDPSKNQQVTAKQYTDISGKTTIIGPPSLPKTKFIFDAVKSGLASNPVEIVVDENIVLFEPAALTFSLPLTANAEQYLPLKITNKTQQELKINNAFITGDFQGLLANGEMQNFIQQYAGVTIIGPLETKTVQVKVATSASANSITGQNLKGSAVFTFASSNNQQQWVQQVPFAVNLNVVGSCDGEAIQFTGAPASGKIDTTAFDNQNQTQFQISNICQVNGQPFELKNLKAKIVWKSNPIGNVELATTDIEGSAQSTETLKSNAYTPLFGTFKSAEDSVYASVMTFTPFPQNIGNTAEFTVVIGAEIGSGNAIKTIEKSFDVKMQITNLDTCIVFTPEPEAGITIEGDEDEAMFIIDTSNCGNVPVDIIFCNGSNNSNCSGGAPEGRLYLSQFTITNLQGSREITVERRAGTLPGTYDLTVDARVPGTSYKRVAALNVRVESDASYAFDLEDSDFALYQQGAKDSTTVINRLLVETIQVKASVCDWEESAGRPILKELGISTLGGFGTAVAASYYGVSISSLSGATICGPACIGAAVAIIIFITLFDDPCDDDLTNALTDYVINLSGPVDKDLLPPDAIDIRLSSNVQANIAANWAEEGSNVFKDGPNTIQAVGAVFTNLTGYSDPNPLFGVATLRATEHIHGDFTHSGSASVTCNNANFGPFLVGGSADQGSCTPTNDQIREEKFHVKFRTQDVNQALPPLQFDSVACVSGNTLGQTGKGTLPRIALNWSWNDSTGIPMYACDASNEDAIFCDATQFNIDLMKRINALQEFLSVNNFNFTCPENPNAQPASGTFPNSSTIPSGFVGFTSIGYQFVSTNAIQLTGTVQNNTQTAQDVQLSMLMTPDNTNTVGSLFGTKTCTANANVPAAGQATLSCTITDLSKTFYTTQFGLESTTTANIAYSSNTLGIDVASYSDASQGTCESLPKTTSIVGGKPGINRWIDKNDPEFGQYVTANVQFTQKIPNVQALNNLLHYEAYLIRDGYSADFENDFKDYYVSTSFADAPTWFKGNAGLNGMASYYGGNDQLAFSNKYFDETTLPAPGKYTIDVSAFFQDDWRFFNTDGTPAASIGVDFYHVELPSPNSPFYKLPFNGGVGLQGTQYSRVGYGVEFINNTQGTIRLDDGVIQTYPGEGSTALAKLNVEKNEDLRKMNSLPSTRGNILEIIAPGGNAQQTMVFTPSLATPIMMQINHAATTQPFSAFYQLSQNGSPVQTGTNLTFWEGAGNCYDFTGVPVYEKFNFTPDRVATPEDKVSAFQFTYGVDWEEAFVGGNEYLRTIFYTPVSKDYALQAAQGNVQYISANQGTPSNSVVLDGITTLPYNNASDMIDSIQDVLDLVADQTICVADSGVKAQFFWNPEKLYKQTSQTSISALTNNLVAGQTCLDAPPQ